MANETYKTLNLDEAAAFLHMSSAVLRRKAKIVQIKGAKPGKCWVFLETDLVDYLRSLYSTYGQAPQSDCKEKNLWHCINAVNTGGSGLQRPMDSEYASLMGLKTKL